MLLARAKHNHDGGQARICGLVASSAEFYPYGGPTGRNLCVGEDIIAVTLRNRQRGKALASLFLRDDGSWFGIPRLLFPLLCGVLECTIREQHRDIVHGVEMKRRNKDDDQCGEWV